MGMQPNPFQGLPTNHLLLKHNMCFLLSYIYLWVGWLISCNPHEHQTKCMLFLFFGSGKSQRCFTSAEQGLQLRPVNATASMNQYSLSLSSTPVGNIFLCVSIIAWLLIAIKKTNWKCGNWHLPDEAVSWLGAFLVKQMTSSNKEHYSLIS